MQLVLIHSPLVGPSFWQPVARELAERGYVCRVPTARANGRDVAPWRHWPERICEAAATPSAPILIGHSAAGRLLPVCAEKLHAAGLVFVDASIPPAAGPVAPAEPEFLSFVRTLPIADGRLPPWCEWWGRQAMTALIRDAALRERFESELPRLTLEWFDDVVPVPAWNALPSGYLQTSQRFSDDAADARERGWPVGVLHGTHLHPLLEPKSTADALAAIIESHGPSQRTTAGGPIANPSATRQDP